MIFIVGNQGNILIVDDSLLQVKAVIEILEKAGHCVFASYDGHDVINIIIDKKIDIVLLDIVLPQTDGFELLKEIMKYEETKEIPVIMVTMLTGGQDVKRALDMGALDYIKKPIDSLEIVARVNSALRLKSKQDLLREYAVRDHLTKLYNRAHFDMMLTRLVESVGDYEKGFSLALIDCDFFKEVNDSYGHIMGDKVLASVANAIFKSVKITDIPCRYGGDEFCLLLPNTTMQEGFIVSERVRRNIEKIKFRFNEEFISMTVSIGLTHLGHDEDIRVSQFIREADQALYKAKSNGRNRVDAWKRLFTNSGNML